MQNKNLLDFVILINFAIFKHFKTFSTKPVILSNKNHLFAPNYLIGILLIA